MIDRSLAALLALAALLGVGCVSEPSLLCDGERVVWSLAEVEIGPEQDVSEEPGIQIDVLLRTTLDPGVEVDLTVRDEEEEVREAARDRVEEDGTVFFPAVTVPVGRVTLEMTAHNGCRQLRASRNVFVFDEMGLPACTLSLAQETIAREAYAPLPVLNAESDGDPALADFQADFSVAAGRPDVEVRLLIVDVESGRETAVEEVSGEARTATFRVTLGQGAQAVRAVCHWPFTGITRTSASRTYFVDTVPPACELLSPEAPITAADDVGDGPGIQFELRGRAGGGDTQGEAARFTVQGEEVEGSPIDEDGESTAPGELPDPPPAEQTFSFESSDHAGNHCLATATFESGG